MSYWVWEIELLGAGACEPVLLLLFPQFRAGRKKHVECRPPVTQVSPPSNSKNPEDSAIPDAGEALYSLRSAYREAQARARPRVVFDVPNSMLGRSASWGWAA